MGTWSPMSWFRKGKLKIVSSYKGKITPVLVACFSD